MVLSLITYVETLGNCFPGHHGQKRSMCHLYALLVQRRYQVHFQQEVFFLSENIETHNRFLINVLNPMTV